MRPSVNRVDGPRGKIGLTPRGMAVLVRLADERGEVVTKQQLLSDVWGEAAVTEDALTQVIVELRKAFDDRATDARVIETIRRVGFRLLLPVQSADEPPLPSVAARRSAMPGWRDARLWIAVAALGAVASAAMLFRGEPGPPHRPVNSVAVLPFSNLSDDPELDYFSDGLSEELLNRLANVGALKVPARTSAFSFKGQDVDVQEIGRRLNVDTVLEGSVRRFHGRVRVTAQLVGVRDGFHIWSQSYDRPLADVFAIQDDIAQSIVEALELQLSPDQLARLAGSPPASLDAYDYYMLGEFHLRKRENLDKPGDWLERARGYYRQALELDPGMARAHVGIAKTFLPLLWSLRADSFDESMEQAQQAIDTALRLDPELGGAYTVLARIRYNRFDYVGVAAAATRALDLNRNDTDAMYYLAQAEENQGRFTAALEIYRRELELDPLNADLVQSVADRLARLGHRDEAVAALAGYFGADSDDAWPLSSIALTYGQYDEAVRIAEQQPDYLFRAAQLAHAWARLGEAELAEAWYQQARERQSYGYIIPMPGVLIRLGKYDELVSMTREAMETQAMPRHERLSPAQYRLLTVAALAQSLTGNYAEAVRYWEWRLENEHVGLLARPEDHVTALTFLAYACRELGETDRSDQLLSSALSVARNAQEEGVNGYPPLTIALARLYALRGQRDLAIQSLDAAIAQGWRDYFGEVRLPMWKSLEADAEYRERLGRVRADLDIMSERALANGEAAYPNQSG